MQEFELYAQKVRDTKPFMDNNKKTINKNSVA